MYSDEPSGPLTSPTGVVLGCADLGQSTRWWSSFGFVAEPAGRIYARPYGGSDSAPAARLFQPDAARGWLELVEVSGAPATLSPYAAGPYALDLYTTDLARSLELAVRAGGTVAGTAEYELGPMVMSEGRLCGPDGLNLVLIHFDRRRPSVLDAHPDRLHSELHCAVYLVDDVVAAGEAWARTGLVAASDVVIDDPGLSELVGVPEPGVTAHLILLAGTDTAPVRLEFMQLSGLLAHPADPARAALFRDGSCWSSRSRTSPPPPRGCAVW